MSRQKIIHLHSSGTTEPSPSRLELGEIAVQYNSEDSCLWIKDNDGNLKKIIESGAVQTMIDNSDIDCGFYYIPPPPYLTFEAVSANSTVKLNRIGTATTLQNAVLQYSTDNGKTWNDYSFTQQGTAGYSGDTITLTNVGDTVKFKGNNGTLGINPSNYHKLVMTGKIKASGDITSLNNEVGGDIPMSAYCYYGLFSGCTSLTTAPALPATNLASTTLANNCYHIMFGGCSSLTTAPELPATTLAASCYTEMFVRCTSLTTAPELPATTLANWCYSSMFQDCTSLTNVQSALPATRLYYRCYASMFNGCTSLTTAPELPATTLDDYCYHIMFGGCSSLTTAPELPATTLKYSCYQKMFRGCTALTNVQSALPATTLANYCYESMFIGCTSLTTAPKLHATTLADYCYRSMFSGCSSLTTAPELPATTLKNYCYENMFYGCSNLNYIKALFTIKPTTAYTKNWVYGVASTGTFVKNSAATWNVTGDNGVPTGWTIEKASS